MGKLWDFIGKQLARLRFGLAYIQMIYYASVILGVIVLVIESVIGVGKIGWEISLGIIVAIFVLEWSFGFYTERKGVIQKDVLTKMKQDIPGRMHLQNEVWKVVQIPMMEELTEKTIAEQLKRFMKEIYEELEQVVE